MELLKLPRRRSSVSDMAYIALNIGLAIALLFVALAYPEVPWVAVALVLLSKWRVFAVRPRFWAANVLANLVDVIVSLSVVQLLYLAAGSVWLQVALTIGYIVWLLWIKPSSRRSMIATQAGVAIFAGITALMSAAYALDSIVIVLGMWVIGFSAARHVIAAYEETHGTLFSFLWGLFFAELGWLAYHWMFAYSLPGFGEIKLVQIAIIALAASLVAERAYASRAAHGMIRANDIMPPALFTAAITIVLFVFFNSIGGIGSGLE